MSNDPSAPGSPPSNPPAGPPPAYQGYQPQPYGYQPYGAPGYAVPQQGNGLAIAAMIVGIVGILLCWAWFIGIILGALGIIFGVIGLQRANRIPGAPNKGMAVAGIVCGAIAVVLDIVFVAVIFAAFHAAVCSTTNTTGC